MLNYNGETLRRGQDYTLAGKTVTMITYVPDSGDELTAFYDTLDDVS